MSKSTSRARAASFRVGGLKRQTSKDESTGRGGGGGEGGGGGFGGMLPPEIFDFNSSQMPRNAFTINQRNPKIQTFGT